MLANSKVIGDISALSNISSLQHISFKGINTTGDISVFSVLINLKAVLIDDMGVLGNVDSFSSCSETAIIGVAKTYV